MNVLELTSLLITFSEAANIAHAVDKLAWARRIVVVDSGSTDGIFDILARYHHVALFKRVFDSFADQCNFGLSSPAPWSTTYFKSIIEATGRWSQQSSGLASRSA